MDGIRKKINRMPVMRLPTVKKIPELPVNKKKIAPERPGNNKPRHFWRFILEILGLVFLFLIISYGSFFGWKFMKVGQNINRINIQSNTPAEKPASLIENIQSVVKPLISSERKKIKGEEEGRINILLLGAGGGKHPGKNLTDTIMIMSIDAKNKKMALLSLPRDLFVNIPDTRVYMKINSVYQYGLNNNEGAEPVKKTVEMVTGEKIHYFVIVDFDGFTKVVDDLGGININVERDIYDTRYPGPNYSYETFELKKGLQLLDGATALKYVRERHDDPEGDFGRAKRQQQLMQSVKNKVFSLGTFLNPLKLNGLLTNLEQNIKTDIGFDEINSFISLSREVDTQNIGNAVVDAWKKESLLKVSHVFSGNVRAFILVPRMGNFSEVKDLAENIFTLEKIEKRKEEIYREAARIVLVNRSSDRQLGMAVKKMIEEKMAITDAILLSEKNNSEAENTEVIDFTRGEKIFTLDELLKKLPARLAENNDSVVELREETDLLIVLGNDLVEPYSYEENSLEELDSTENQNDYLEIVK
jgi:polyisoprenyl-teichoic acid--peptidoglycan teichoic acid transferase